MFEFFDRAHNAIHATVFRHPFLSPLLGHTKPTAMPGFRLDFQVSSSGQAPNQVPRPADPVEVKPAGILVGTIVKAIHHTAVLNQPRLALLQDFPFRPGTFYLGLHGYRPVRCPAVQPVWRQVLPQARQRVRQVLELLCFGLFSGHPR